MTPQEIKQFMQRFVQETLNQKNLDVLNEMVAEDFVEHVPFPGQGPGREGLRYAITTLLSAFPDMKWTVEEQIAEGEKVVSRFTMTGTHQGEFLGIAATGRPIQVWGMVLDVVREGKFAESRILLDMLGLMGQLGVIPSAGAEA